MHALCTFRQKGLQASEHTLAVGIGQEGVSHIDDVACFRVLYEGLVRTLPDRRAVVMWMLVCHMLVRPHLVEYVRQMVCARGLPATYECIVEVMTSLSRRWGQVRSRMPAGQRSWRDVDVFGIASTQTRGAQYCGSHKLYEQLLQFDDMETLADGIADLSFQTVYFEDLVRFISQSKLPGYAVNGYWTIHLARVFVPAFAGVTLLGRVRYRPACARLLFGMGDGAGALVRLGVDEQDPHDDMLDLCRIVTVVGRVHGYGVRFELPHLVCAVCEALREVRESCVWGSVSTTSVGV